MRITSWVQAHIGGAVLVPVEDNQIQAAQLPKPKFEFYTLLTQEKTRQNPVTSAAPSPKKIVAVEDEKAHAKRVYVLQLASFQRREDAEHMQALLIMRGFDVSIKTIKQEGAAWHRVMMGPFPSKLQAEKIQGAIVQSEQISGIVRRMDA